MTYLSPASALVAYRAGKPDEALALAGRALADDPFAAEAHLATALVRMSRNEVPQAVDALRKCLASRSAEWILERMRQAGAPPMRQEMAFRLGGFLRSNLRALGPVLPPEARRAQDEFINVVGSSYVRSFGGSPALFPLFIGMGPTMLLLDPAAAAITRRKTAENLKRVDPRRNTMLILGADPDYYAKSLAKAGEARPDGPTPADEAALDAIATHHAPILADAQKLITGKLMLLGTTPTQDPLTNAFSVSLNARLKSLCAAMDVIFLDWWDELADPATGRLRDDLNAKAYPGDVHFTLQATKRFMQLLKDQGLFGPDVEPSADYEWSHVFEVAVDASEKTRLWSEPSVTPKNAIQSHKVAASHLAGHVADLLTTLGAERAGQTHLMLNVRDGYLPTAIPPQIYSGGAAFTDTADNLRVGQQVLDFYGRSDIRLALGDDLSVLAGQQFGRVTLLLHPNSAEADAARCREALSRLGGTPQIVVGTPFPERLGELGLGERSVVTFNVSNRHIPEIWRNYSVALVR